MCCLVVLLAAGVYLLWYFYGSLPLIALGGSVGAILVFIFYKSRKGKEIAEKMARKRLFGTLDKRLEERRFEKEQEKKGLIKYVDEAGNVLWGTPEQVAKWKLEGKKREIIIQKEIVKARCRYCGKLYDVTLDKCPHCGGGR